jgi:hypothetical protein
MLGTKATLGGSADDGKTVLSAFAGSADTAPAGFTATTFRSGEESPGFAPPACMTFRSFSSGDIFSCLSAMKLLTP